MTRTTFEVGTADLRRGIAAVLPHVDPDKDAPTTHRLRIELDEVADGEALMMATDHFTAAIYSLDPHDIRTDGIDYLDLTPADAAKIVAVFRVGKDEDADYPDSMLRFECTEKLVTITDVSGMFEGHRLELPATPPCQYPNVPKLIGSRLAELPAERFRIQVTGKFLARFAASSKALGVPLNLDPTAGPMLVTAGETFVGAFMPSRMTDADHAAVWDARAAWQRTLRPVGARAAHRNVQPGDVDERTAKALRFVAERQNLVIKGLADYLEVGTKEAKETAAILEDWGVVGPAKKGRGRDVFLAPDGLDEALRRLRDGLPPMAGDVERMPGGDVEGTPPGTAEAVAELGAPVDLDAGDPFGGTAGAAGSPVGDASPFSDVPTPPEPFRDSDGNTWTTVDPFAGDNEPDPFA